MLRPTLIALTLCLTAPALAEGPGLSPKRMAVDVVSIKGGPQLFGLVLQQAADGRLLFAVERDWLRSNHKRYYTEVSTAEATLAEAAGEELLERIRRWIKRRATDRNLVLFLDQELQRLEADRDPKDADAKTEKEKDTPAKDAEKPVPLKEKQFVLVDIPGDKVRSLFRQPPERRQLALLAWQHRLKNVATRTANSLMRELQEAGVEIGPQPVDLADRFPGQVLDERQWAARVALVEYRLKQKLSFQGEGEFLARTGDGAVEVDLAELVGKIVEQQLKAQRAIAEGRPSADSTDWMKKPIEEAEYAGLTGFLAARLHRQFVFTGTAFEFPKEAIVELTFVARQPDGAWQPIWSVSETQDAASVRPETKAEVAAGAEINKVLDLLKLAGLAKDGSTVDRAIAFGAAAKQAQSAAEQKFHEFLLLYTRQIDAPPIPLAVSAAGPG